MSVPIGRSARRLLALSVAVGTSLALGGCASSSGGAPPAGGASGASSSGSATASAASGGSAAPGSDHRTAAELGQALATAVRAEGSVLVTAKGAQGVTARRSLQWSGGHDRLLVDVDVPGSKRTSLLVVDGVAYSPTTESATGKHWLQLTPEMLSTSPLVTATITADLASSYQALGKARAFRDGGTSGAGADRVHTYTLTVGPEAARGLVVLDRVPKQLRAAVQKNIDQADYTVTIGVGADGLPRTQTTSGSGSGAGSTETFSRWGQVTVPVPAADDVLR